MPLHSLVLILLNLYGFRLFILLKERKGGEAFWLKRRMQSLPYFLLYNINSFEKTNIKRNIFTISTTVYSATYIAKYTGSWNHWCLFDPYVTNHKHQQKVQTQNLPLTFNLKCILKVPTRNVDCTLSRNSECLPVCLKMWNKKIYSPPSPNVLLEASHLSLLFSHSVGFSFSCSLYEICPHLVVFSIQTESKLWIQDMTRMSYLYKLNFTRRQVSL